MRIPSRAVVPLFGSKAPGISFADGQSFVFLLSTLPLAFAGIRRAYYPTVVAGLEWPNCAAAPAASLPGTAVDDAENRRSLKKASGIALTEGEHSTRGQHTEIHALLERVVPLTPPAFTQTGPILVADSASRLEPRHVRADDAPAFRHPHPGLALSALPAG